MRSSWVWLGYRLHAFKEDAELFLLCSCAFKSMELGAKGLGLSHCVGLSPGDRSGISSGSALEGVEGALNLLSEELRSRKGLPRAAKALLGERHTVGLSS